MTLPDLDTIVDWSLAIIVVCLAAGYVAVMLALCWTGVVHLFGL